MCSLFCLGLHEGCNAGVFFNPSQQWPPPSPEQKGFLQLAAFLLRAAWVKCEPADVQHSQPTGKSPGDHENQAWRVFLFFGFFLEDSLCYWLISFVFSAAEAVWANNKPYAADVWPVHIRGNRYGWQWLSRYVCYSGSESTAGMQQQAEKTAELVVSRLLVTTIVGGQWSWAFSSLFLPLFEAPDKNLSQLLDSGV